MINLQDNLTKRNVLITIAVVAALILMQLLLMNKVKSIDSENQAARFEVKTLDNMLKRRADTVMLYKSVLKFDHAVLPVPVDTPTKFYAYLINVLSSTELRGAEVSNAAESPGVISFRVNGEAAYFSLLEVLAEFRQSSHMVRLTELMVEGRDHGVVKYSFVIQAKVKEPDNNEAGGDVR